MWKIIIFPYQYYQLRNLLQYPIPKPNHRSILLTPWRGDRGWRDVPTVISLNVCTIDVLHQDMEIKFPQGWKLWMEQFPIFIGKKESRGRQEIYLWLCCYRCFNQFSNNGDKNWRHESIDKDWCVWNIKSRIRITWHRWHFVIKNLITSVNLVEINSTQKVHCKICLSRKKQFGEK